MQLVHGELDWIVMKALEKDRTRRYETASKFAEDVQHYLNDEAVAACPPSAAYRFRKFARRNKALIATTAVVAASLIAGIFGTSWQAYRAKKAERTAEERLDTVESQKEQIEREKQNAIAQADRADIEAEKAKAEAAIAQAVNDFLNKDLLSQADPKKEPDRDIKLRTVVDRAAEKIEGRFADQPLVEAAICQTLGLTYQALGEYGKAQQQHRRARELRQRELGIEHPSTLTSMTNIAVALDDQKRWADAEELLRSVFEIQQRVSGPEHSDTLVTAHNLASVLRHQGRYAECEKIQRNVLDIRQRVFGPEHRLTLLIKHGLASTAYQSARYAEAERLANEALEVQRRVLGSEHPDTLHSLHLVALAIGEQGRVAESEKLFRETLELERRILGSEHPDTLGCMNGLACAVMELGRNVEAESLHGELLVIRKRLFGLEHPETLRSMHNLACAIDRQGRTDEAEKLRREIVKTSSRVLGPAHPETLLAVANLTASLSSSPGSERVLDTVEQVIDASLERSEREPDDENTRVVLRAIARNMASRAWRMTTHEDYKQVNAWMALRLTKKAIELQPDDADITDVLGVAQYRNAQWRESVESLEKAREMRGGKDPAHQFFLAMAYWQVGQHDDAVENFVQAAKRFAERRPGTGQHRFRLEAEELLRPDGIELAIDTLGEKIDQSPAERDLRLVRARLYTNLQSWDEAAADWLQVIDLTEDPRAWPSPRQAVCREIAASPELFDHVAQLRTDEPAVWIGRGQYHVLRSQWAEAVSDYARAAPLQPVADQTYQYAGLLLLVGDEESYREYCAELSALVDAPAFLLARSCAIGPESGVEPSRILEWAKQGDTAWEMHVLGLARYRSGRFDKAIQSLEASNAGNWSALAKAQNDLVLAMAHHRQGDQLKAQQLLQRAKTTIDNARPQQTNQPVDVAVPDWIGIETLRREAEELIGLHESELDEPEQTESDKLNAT